MYDVPPQQYQEESADQAIYEEFPEDKIKLPAESSRATNAQLYEAIYDYEGQAEGDLSFKAGEVIEVCTIMFTYNGHRCRSSWVWVLGVFVCVCIRVYVYACACTYVCVCVCV